MSRYAARLGPNWPAISADWRAKQIEYSWVRSLAGATHHRDFWCLTEESLAWTAARHGITDSVLLADVLQAYRQLDAFADAAPALTRLRNAGINRVILSNGEPGMLADAVRTAGIESLLDGVLSVEAVGVFKPEPRAYRLATEHFGLSAEQMAFVSSNPWDAFGARAFGFQAFWINRGAAPHEYDLKTTATELRKLAALPDKLAL
jgi:2-haloacid dehalogenase